VFSVELQMKHNS